jgi:hypothetical protein
LRAGLSRPLSRQRRNLSQGRRQVPAYCRRLVKKIGTGRRAAAHAVHQQVALLALLGGEEAALVSYRIKGQGSLYPLVAPQCRTSTFRATDRAPAVASAVPMTTIATADDSLLARTATTRKHPRELHSLLSRRGREASFGCGVPRCNTWRRRTARSRPRVISLRARRCAVSCRHRRASPARPPRPSSSAGSAKFMTEYHSAEVQA